MEEGSAPYADLDEIIGEDLHKSPPIRACAVKAELQERERAHRVLTQDEIAGLVGVDSRTLRIWVARYLEEGADGLKRHKGQGRKPGLSDEQVRAAIERAQESGGLESAPEDEAGRCGACREAAEAGERGGRAPRRKAPAPAACGCGGRCEISRKCGCKPGGACRCKCCRGARLPPRGPRHARGCPRAGALPAGAVTAILLHGSILDMYGKSYSMSRIYALMHKHGLVFKRPPEHA